MNKISRFSIITLAISTLISCGSVKDDSPIPLEANIPQKLSAAVLSTALVGGPPRTGGLNQQALNVPFRDGAQLLHTALYSVVPYSPSNPNPRLMRVSFYINASNKFTDSVTNDKYAAFATSNAGSFDCRIDLNADYAPRNPYFISSRDSGSAQDSSGINQQYFADMTDVMAHEFGHCVDGSVYNWNSNGVNPQNAAKYGPYFTSNSFEAYAQAYSENYKNLCGAYGADMTFKSSPYTITHCTKPQQASGGRPPLPTNLYSVTPKPTSDPASFIDSNVRCSSNCAYYPYYYYSR